MAGFSSSYISSAIGAGNAQFAQNNYLAQQMAAPDGQGAAIPPPTMMAPPRPPQALTIGGHFSGDRGGMMGETAAANVGSFASNIAMPIAGGAAALAGVDPFSMTMRAGAAGLGAGGMMGGAAMAAGVAMPLYAGAKLAQSYGSAFTGGMQDQGALNSTLRSNFNQLGGSRGQGFSQQQMGSIGGVVQNELDSNIFTNSNELNSLISQGAQGGMFSGVRDVGEFSKKFKNMLDTLKSVQKELGGSLNEAMQFVQEAKQSGVFNRMDRQNFAGQIREVTQMTGMSREDAMTMASQGAQISRQAGGTGAQGAFGAMKMGRTLGSAITTGAIDESMLSEATGGLTGNSAIQAFTGQMMQRTARFSRKAMGRYSMFAMADPDNMGQLDRGAMAQFAAGDISVGSVSRRAHHNVNRMGRAQAINREGELRGAMLEQGGMAGQIGMMKLMLGDRVMNQGDDISQLVMQRRFGMSRPQAEVMQSLMRNQGSIAEQESMDRSASARSASRENVRRERGLDAVMDKIGHEIEHGLGIHEVRQMGRNFVTKLSSAGQKAMDNMLGIYTQEMTNPTSTAVNRAVVGQARRSDLAHLSAVQGVGRAAGGTEGFDPFQLGVMQRLSGGSSLGSRLEGMGYDVSGYGRGDTGRRRREHGLGNELSDGTRRRRTVAALAEIRMGQSGIVAPGQEAELASMLEDTTQTNAQMMSARVQARGRGDVGQTVGVLQDQGMSRGAAMAYMARQGMSIPGTGGSLDASMVGGRRGGGAFGLRDSGREVSNWDIAAGAAIGGVLGGGVGAAFGEQIAELGADLNLMGSTSRERSLNFLASGGHKAGRMREIQAGRRRPGEDMPDGARLMGGRALRRHYQNEIDGLEINAEALDALTQEDDVRRLTLRMANGGPDARRALEEFNVMARGADPASERGRALDSLATNASEAIEKHGKVGPEMVGAVLSPQAREDAAAARAELTQRAVGFTSAAGALDALSEGNATSAVLREASNAMIAGDAGQVNSLMSGEIDRISRLSNDDRADLIRDMTATGNEDMSTIATMASTRAQTRQSLEGRGRGGRRGNRQRMETAMQQLGGTGLGRNFSVTVGQGDRTREVTGRRAQRMMEGVLRGGGYDAYRAGTATDQQRSVIEGMRTQMRESGLGSDARHGVLSALQAQAEAQTPEDRVTAAQGVMDMRERYQPEFEAAEKKQRDESMARLRAQNPLDGERNTLLQRIVDNTGTSSDSSPGATGGIPGVNMSEAP